MRHFVFVFALPAVAACASSASKPETGLSAPGERIVATDNRTSYRTTVAPNAKAVIAAPPAKAFDALKGVYAELGIPAGMSDPATGKIGNVDFWKTRKLANESISTFLNCGDSFMGSAADNYRIYMSLVSAVRPNGNGATELETAFTASAKNMDGTAGDLIPCGTSGRMEERIKNALLTKLGLPQQ